MKKSEEIVRYFDELYPNAKCELTYNSDYGFLIAVMLSAQCTDNKVNKVIFLFSQKPIFLDKSAPAKIFPH